MTVKKKCARSCGKNLLENYIRLKIMDLSNNVISESVKKRKEKMISKSEWFGGNLKSKTVNYLNNVKFFSQKFYSWTFVH